MLFGVNTSRIHLSRVQRSPSTQVTRCAISWGETLHWDRSPAFRGDLKPQAWNKTLWTSQVSRAHMRSPFAETWVRKGELCLVQQTPRSAVSKRPLSAWLPHLWVCLNHPHRFSRCFSQQDQTALCSGLAWQEKASLAPVQVGKARGRSLIAQLWVSRLVSDTPLLVYFHS